MAKLSVTAGFARLLATGALLTWASLGLHPLMERPSSLQTVAATAGSHAAAGRTGLQMGHVLANVVIQQRPPPASASRRQPPNDKAAPVSPPAPPDAAPAGQGASTSRIAPTQPEPAEQSQPIAIRPPAGPAPSEAASEQLASSLRSAEDKLKEGRYEEAEALARTVAQRADGDPALRAKALSVSERAKAAKAVINWAESVR